MGSLPCTSSCCDAEPSGLILYADAAGYGGTGDPGWWWCMVSWCTQGGYPPWVHHDTAPPAPWSTCTPVHRRSSVQDQATGLKEACAASGGAPSVLETRAAIPTATVAEEAAHMRRDPRP